MRNKKGMYFTLITIVFLVLFSFLFLMPSYTRLQEKMFVTEMRVESMNNLIKDIQRDSQRGLYISSYRALLALEEFILLNGTFLDNTKIRFKEALFNGTVYDSTSSLMLLSTFPEWIQKIKQDTTKFNVETEIIIENVDIYHNGPWSVIVEANLTISLDDVTNIASWQRNENIVSTISIIDFEDPLYIVNSYGRTTNTIRRTLYEGNYTYNKSGIMNVDNLLDHTTYSYYTAHNDAPSFLMRLENDLSSSPYGIESLVNLKKMNDIGLNISTQSSIVDYYYWAGISNGDYRVSGTPSWFRLDANHLNKYEVADIVYLD